jgi:hypothetical protein
VLPIPKRFQAPQANCKLALSYQRRAGKREEAPLGKGKLVDILYISHFFHVFNPHFVLFFIKKKYKK